MSRGLFDEDLEEQAQALIRMLRFIVNNLDDSSIIESALMVLGNNNRIQTILLSRLKMKQFLIRFRW